MINTVAQKHTKNSAATDLTMHRIALIFKKVNMQLKRAIAT